ncbi:TetR family transcriptional regulator [Streptomyces sp. M41(2017)]|uniref:TetR/AcrR family transcriptional regulator n=1 Tax=Streptomyces sp. M41(2017) TaxID=1955065 RepID=UPI0015C43A37|nr:TetR family transcriptional regulator [Streptomyces sp. M41(2017)]
MTQGDPGPQPDGMCVDPPRVAWRRQMREQVLAAAAELASVRGWDRVRVADLAERAEVSRPSIYKEFGDRAGIARALVRRETDHFLRGVAEALERPGHDVATCLVGAVFHALNESVDNPLISAVLRAARHGTDGLLPFLASRPDPIFDSARSLLEAWLTDRDPTEGAWRTADAADVAVRLTLSHMLLPADDSEPVPERITQAVLAVLTPIG